MLGLVAAVPIGWYLRSLALDQVHNGFSADTVRFRACHVLVLQVAKGQPCVKKRSCFTGFVTLFMAFLMALGILQKALLMTRPFPASALASPHASLSRRCLQPQPALTVNFAY